MKEIKRYDINEEWAHSGIIQAGNFCFINYCVRNIGGTVEEQIDGAFDEMEERLALVGLSLENVVQMNCLFKNIWDIPVMANILYASHFKPSLQTHVICFSKWML